MFFFNERGSHEEFKGFRIGKKPKREGGEKEEREKRVRRVVRRG